MKITALATLAAVTTVEAITWNFVAYIAPVNQKFLRFNGLLTAPPIPKAATYYLWPGLQPSDNSGIYQNVLDGRKGAWWFASGWCCGNPSLPWGGGGSVAPAQKAFFTNELNGTSWTSKTGIEGGAPFAINDFPLTGKSFNRAVFAIELYDTAWDFGPLAFSNVVITSTGTDAGWCNTNPSNYNGATVFTVSGVRSVINANTVDCYIDSLVLLRDINAPAAAVSSTTSAVAKVATSTTTSTTSVAKPSTTSVLTTTMPTTLATSTAKLASTTEPLYHCKIAYVTAKA